MYFKISGVDVNILGGRRSDDKKVWECVHYINNMNLCILCVNVHKTEDFLNVYKQQIILERNI